MMSNPKLRLNLAYLIKFAILALWLISQILQLRTGLADNGDLIRLGNWFSSGPVGFSEGWIAPENPRYFDRYFTYWLPEWRLDYPMQGSVLSSALLLWIPGITLNTLLTSGEVLNLAWVSLLPRILALIFLLGVFKWVDRYTNRRALFYLTLVLPLALMTSTTDYVAYFNTLYQETAAFIGLLYLIWSLLAFGCHPSGRNFAFYLASLVLITLSRASAFYWPILTAPFILIPVRTLNRRWMFYAAIALCIVFLPFFSLKVTTVPAMHQINRFNAFYTGILPFSSKPGEILSDLSMEGTEDCIDNTDYYSDARIRCLGAVSDRVDRVTSARIMIGEPAILLRQFIYGLSQLQQLGLRGSDYYAYNLGNYAPGDAGPPGADFLNLWSNIKSNSFPKGWWAFFTMLICSLIFGYHTRFRGWISRLSWVGFLLLSVLVVDLMVAINGDGKYEIIKHLFMSNMIFDLMLILAANLLLLQFVEKPDNPLITRGCRENP